MKEGITSKLYAHQGCYLSLPDDGYITYDAPFFNKSLVEREVSFLKREIDGAAKLDFTGFVHLMPSIDDFVSYAFLKHPQKGKRKRRADGLASVIKELIEFAHERDMKYYIQNYEFLVDKWVSENLPVNGMKYFLKERYREFFERTGVDGIVVTPSEAKNRGGCRYIDFQKFYKTVAGMARDFYSVIVDELGKELRFRLWLQVRTEKQWAGIERDLPEGLMVTLKNTDGDYWAGAPQNPIISVAAEKYSLSVLFDIYGEYHGWGRLLYFDPSWPQDIERCRKLKVSEIQTWGSWSPACIWPNEDDDFLTGHKCWAESYPENGLWEGNHLGGQLSIRYLLNLLDGAESPEDALLKAAESCSFNSDCNRIVRALKPIENLWREVYLPGTKMFYPLVNSWAMIFQEPRKTWRDLIRTEGRNVVYESNKRMLNELKVLKKERQGIQDPCLREIWELTELYFETQIVLREAACIDPIFASEDAFSYECSLTRCLKICDYLKNILGRWEDYPVEAKAWCITEFDACRLSVRPYWLRAGSLRKYEEKLRLGLVRDIPREASFQFYRWNVNEKNHPAR